MNITVRHAKENDWTPCSKCKSLGQFEKAYFFSCKSGSVPVVYYKGMSRLYEYHEYVDLPEEVKVKLAIEELSR